MKDIAGGLLSHLEEEVTKLATCWVITLQNGQTFRFTDHDKDITVVSGSPVEDQDGTYISAVGYSGSNISHASDGSVDNMEVVAIIDDAGISEDDLQGGVYNGAEVRLFGVAWDNPSQGIARTSRGFFGEYGLKSNQATIEFRELQQVLHQKIGRTVKPACDADLGDDRCQVNLTPLTVTGTVSSATDRARFVGNTSGSGSQWYRFGVVTWLTGLNAGLRMEVKSHSGTSLELFLPMPYQIQNGDTYSIYPGCDKLKATCISKFNNIDNFQGFPDVPGSDAMLNPPDEE